MSPSIANLAYALGIAGLFLLNRDNSIRTSRALWLPVLYLWVLGSRPLAYWMNGGFRPGSIDQALTLDSPIDEAFFAALLVLGLYVLVQRGQRVFKFVGASGPVLLYFSYCFLSVLWSDSPSVSGKRWVKSIGDLVMILIVLTDRQPMAALSRLYSRTAIILFPLSMLFCKYYPDLGRAYDPYTGRQMFTGLTTDKNMLGVITYVLTLGVLWRVLSILRSDEKPRNRRRVLVAQGALFAAGIYLLIIADSVTSKVAFALGAGLMLVTSLKFMRRRAAAVHMLVLLLIGSASSMILLGGQDSAIQALGRNPTLTGRTVIWATLIPMEPNPVLGAGFESFWLNRDVREKLAVATGGQDLNEAHDGYLEVYLELGWVGVGLIVLILVDGYRRSVAAFRRNPTWGSLLIAYIVSAMVYNVTEAGFRMMDPIWVFLLFAVAASGGISSGIRLERSEVPSVTATSTRGRKTIEWVAARGVRSSG